jgi:hypothetical protein
VAACALALVAAAVCVHLGMLFLHVAPPNTLSKRHGDVVDEWIYPEFEQNWKLFAPNPLQQNVAVQVRAEVSTADGGIRTTGWYDLSAEDGRAIDGDPLPSHTRQNQLRRAWDFYVATHDSRDRPVGLRGALAETYLRRIAVLRLERNDAAGPGGVVERVQFRSRTTSVPPPPWSREKVSAQPVHRVLPWWPVPPDRADGRSPAASPTSPAPCSARTRPPWSASGSARPGCSSCCGSFPTATSCTVPTAPGAGSWPSG